MELGNGNDLGNVADKTELYGARPISDGIISVFMQFSVLQWD